MVSTRTHRLPLARRDLDGRARQDRALCRRRAARGDCERGRLRRVPRTGAAPGAGPRRSRLRESSASLRVRRTWRVARADRADPAARGHGRDRARRQVREAPRRLPLCARGAQARGNPPRLSRAGPLGSDAEGMSLEEAQRELEQVDGVLVPAGFGSRGWEARSSPAALRGSSRSPTSDLPRHACGRLGVCAPRVGLRRCELDRDGSRDAVPVIDLLPEQKEGRGPRRHDAPRRPGGRDRAGHAHR